MKKADFNKEAAKEIGALEALATVKPDAKDHAAMFAFCEKQRAHHLNLDTLLVNFIGNGMAAEIGEEAAERVIAYIKDNQQVFMLMSPDEISSQVAAEIKKAMKRDQYLRFKDREFPVSKRFVTTAINGMVGILLLLNLLFGKIDAKHVLGFFGMTVG